MLGVGAGFTFIDDWAHMVQRFADVIGLTPIATLPPSARRLSRRMALGSHDGFQVLFTTIPAWRPKRVFWRVNRRLEAAALRRAATRLQTEAGTVDLIHSHFYAVSGAVPAAAAALGVPFVHTEHSSQLIDPDQRISRAGRAAMARVFSQAARVFFVGDHQLAAARRLGLNGRFAVVANPVDPRLFTGLLEGSGTGMHLITVGKLRRLKRHDITLRALALLTPQRPDLTLEIVGEGPREGELEDLAHRLGVADRVSFPGRLTREEVATRLRRATVYVHAAERETFGVALVEALLSGLPVVAHSAGGVTSELPPGTGVTVAGSDPADLAAGIEKVLAQPGAFDRENIRRVARERYGVAGVARVVNHVYDEVASRG